MAWYHAQVISLAYKNRYRYPHRECLVLKMTARHFQSLFKKISSLQLLLLVPKKLFIVSEIRDARECLRFALCNRTPIDIKIHHLIFSVYHS
jgi:hypothetical protein